MNINDTILERERYYICNYLATLGNHNFFHYPLEVENIDLGQGIPVPDFRINDFGYEYYLELATASTKQFMDERKRTEDFSETEYSIIIEEEEIRISSSEVKDGRLTGRPVFGNLVENICGRILTQMILHKTSKLQNYRIDRNKNIELLLYYLFPYQSGLDWNKGFEFAYMSLSKANYGQGGYVFDRIHLLNDSNLWYKILNVKGVGLATHEY